MQFGRPAREMDDRDGWRELGKSVLSVRLDYDDDDWKNWQSTYFSVDLFPFFVAL